MVYKSRQVKTSHCEIIQVVYSETNFGLHSSNIRICPSSFNNIFNNMHTSIKQINKIYIFLFHMTYLAKGLCMKCPNLFWASQTGKYVETVFQSGFNLCMTDKQQ